MAYSKFKINHKSRLHARKKEIKTSLRKSGIKTIEDVLNTSILSNHSKVNYIRHKFTCYNNYLLTFYRNDEGIRLRKELNEMIVNVVDKKIEPSELLKYDEELKVKLKKMNKQFEEKCKENVIPTEEPVVEKLDFSVIPEIPNLTEIERKFLQTIPANYCSTKLTEENKVEICMDYIKQYKENWKRSLLDNLKRKHVNGYLVETYLENRDKDFYPQDFSDLDFIKWKKLISEAREWLYHKFDGDHIKAEQFINTVLPKWIENNADGFKSKIL